MSNQDGYHKYYLAILAWNNDVIIKSIFWIDLVWTDLLMYKFNLIKIGKINQFIEKQRHCWLKNFKSKIEIFFRRRSTFYIWKIVNWFLGNGFYFNRYFTFRFKSIYFQELLALNNVDLVFLRVYLFLLFYYCRKFKILYFGYQ